MVELRWAVPATTTKAPRLQYRQLPSVVTLGGPGWSEWQDVPWVVVPEAPQPAPTVLSAPGVGAPRAPTAQEDRWLHGAVKASSTLVAPGKLAPGVGGNHGR